jgi:putative alpha-1,2-mannosidase
MLPHLASYLFSLAPHFVVETAIDLVGGNKAFVERLTVANDNYYEAYNEPGMLQTFLFTHAGRPDKTQFYLRKALEHFNTSVSGLPGNDDSGTTSGWLVWAMLGIYPNAGQDFYYVGSPIFTKATLQLADGKKLVINANGTSDVNKYVASAKLNGKTWTQAWLRHEDFIKGAVLDLSMSGNPSSWGTKTPPPSLSSPSTSSK